METWIDFTILEFHSHSFHLFVRIEMWNVEIEIECWFINLREMIYAQTYFIIVLESYKL